jgi:hypothetical protein
MLRFRVSSLERCDNSGVGVRQRVDCPCRADRCLSTARQYVVDVFFVVLWVLCSLSVSLCLCVCASMSLCIYLSIYLYTRERVCVCVFKKTITNFTPPPSQISRVPSLHSVYFDLVLQQPFQVRRSPLLGLEKVFTWLRRKLIPSTQEHVRRGGYAPLNDLSHTSDFEDAAASASYETMVGHGSLDSENALNMVDRGISQPMIHLKDLNMVFDTRPPCHGDRDGCSLFSCG